MKKILLAFSITLFAITVNGQLSDPYQVLCDTSVYKFGPGNPMPPNGTINSLDSASRVNYIAILGKMLANKGELIQHSSRSQFFSSLGTYLSFISDVDKALSDYDSTQTVAGWTDSKLYEIGKKQLERLFLKDARATITGMARHRKIVMINEAHHQPRHRIFTYTLLNDLYLAGYRYFGLETLTDFAINEPVSTRTGYYTLEPAMADLVRYAKEIGYTLFAYESHNFDGKVRDSIQAENIMAAIKRWPDGKFLIHAGYGHISKHYSDYPMMAAVLKKRSAIDPLSVNQVNFSEKSGSAHFRVMHDMIAKRFPDSTEGPYAMFTNNELYQLTKDSMHDVYIYTPPAEYTKQRPTWLLANGMRKKVAIQIPREFRKECFVVQAYFNDEFEKFDPDTRIPLDQTYFLYKGKTDLYLRKGKFKIVFRNINNEIIGTRELAVK
jgi:hypothetical protein